ncbi:21939_t:CDS:2, partial [Cetraspora pellucida]
QSIYDYCIITEEHKEYLWSSKNYSNISHHTGQFLDKEIINVVEDIGPEKIATIVSDNAANILSEHENDLKPQIKDILRDQIFYEDCRLIASILHPFKISVGCLELRTSNLTDCYVYLVLLANAIFRIPNQNIAFKNYCSGIDSQKFHDINIIAVQIWKDIGHDQELYISADNDNISTEIDISQIYTLDIIKDIDIGLQMFNIDQRTCEEEVTGSSRRQAIVLEPQRNDFDVESLARNMSIEINNVEDS